MTAPTTPSNMLAERSCREGPHDVVQQPHDALRKYALLAGFGAITLYDADAAERFGEPAGDFGVDLAALPKNRADGLKSLFQRECKAGEKSESKQRHHGADLEQDYEGNGSGDQATHEIDQAGPYQVANAFDVGHDARD